jgi:hypothetical protein
MFHIHLHNNTSSVLSCQGKPLSLPCTRCQGVTKRCRLSLLTNSALDIRVQMRGEGGSCGVSPNEYTVDVHIT